MSQHVRGSGRSTAWLVADQDNREGQPRATTATLAMGWARVRVSQARSRMPDHRTFWAGTGPTPPGFAGTWVEDGRETAKHVLRGERS